MSTDLTEPADAAGAPSEVREPSGGGIVVGVDGSEGSCAALDYACDEAALRVLPLTAVVAWTPPEACVTPYPQVTSAHDIQAAATALATQEIRSVLAARAARGASTPDVALHTSSGPAAVVLERLSADASMLVVGHRGRGAVMSRLIGSVGLSTVVHAHCTVVVVRPSATHGPETDEHESHAT
jgi:nucleotide-binding universal stress UspA family protein